MFISRGTVFNLFWLCLIFSPLVLAQNCAFSADLFPLSAQAFQNDDDDSQSYCGSPLHISVQDTPNGACLQFQPARGVVIGQLGYVIFSGSNNSLSNATAIVNATGNGINITSKVSLMNYTPGSSMVCENRPSCSSLDVWNPTSQDRLQPNQVALCLACQKSSYNYAPIQVCFSGVTAQSFAGTRVTASISRITDYCVTSANVAGTIPTTCSGASSCLPLEGVVVCDQQCEGKLPLAVKTATSGPNTVCVGAFPVGGVTIKDLKYMSFVGSHNPLLDTATTIVSARNAWNADITKDVFIEVYTGGRACSSDRCLGYEVNVALHDEMHIGDINVCLGCSHSQTGNDDDPNYWGVEAPLEVCFSRTGLTEESFANSIIKMRAAGVKGFCGIGCLRTVAVMQCKASATNVVDAPEEDCDEVKHEDDDDEDNSEDDWHDDSNWDGKNDNDDSAHDNYDDAPVPVKGAKPRRVYTREITKTYYVGKPKRSAKPEYEDDDEEYDSDDDEEEYDDDDEEDDDEEEYDDDDNDNDDDEEEYSDDEEDDYSGNDDGGDDNDNDDDDV